MTDEICDRFWDTEGCNGCPECGYAIAFGIVAMAEAIRARLDEERNEADSLYLDG